MSLPFPFRDDARIDTREDLRDRFTMAALVGNLANDAFAFLASVSESAELCWQIADAMLATREGASSDGD